MAILHPVWRRVRSVLEPPPPLSISQWADEHRVLGPSSPLPGTWRTSVAPYLREPMDCLSPDSGIERVVVLKPVQSGFSEMLLNAAAYYLVHAPSAVLIVQPNEKMSRRYQCAVEKFYLKRHQKRVRCIVARRQGPYEPQRRTNCR